MKPVIRVCGNRNPDRQEISCDLSTPNHPLCTGLDPSASVFVDWSNPDYRKPPPKVDGRETAARMKEIQAQVEPVTRAEGFAAGVEASGRSAGTWTQEQKDLVFKAIRAVAERHEEFTTDQVWEELDGRVPITKGMTAMLMLASRRGILDSTGKTTTSTRGGQHDHGQRLTIWYSLIRTAV